jgi:2-amino-4-hydroxy-6-hydroxymethyldihydropteridine diphosphokinase
LNDPVNPKPAIFIKGKSVKTPATRIILGIGANLIPDGYETPQQGCAAAIGYLAQHDIRVLDQSRWFETAPVPISDQPWFVNAVILAETELTAAAALAALHRIEKQFGRTRKQHNEARVLDIDLLDYGGMVTDREDLILPHPRMHERAFVLLPLNDVVPEWVHPITRSSIATLIAALPDDQIIRPLGDGALGDSD